jgi:hypothetical protein
MCVRIAGWLLLCWAAGWMGTHAVAADAATGRSIPLGSELKMTVPTTWVAKTPRMQMIEHEFAIPAAEGDKGEGRLTVMTAGGSVQANVERWLGQFTQPDGSPTRPKAKIDRKSVANREVIVVDVAGTYRDSRGPFAPAVDRPGYRMLAAIIPTSQANYFVKLYGPEKTVQQNAKAFEQMVEGIALP